MKYQNIVGKLGFIVNHRFYTHQVAHSGRHEEMRMVLLNQTQLAEIIKRPIEYGLTEQLRGVGYGMKKDRDAVIYACRHCHQVRNHPGEQP